MAHRDLSAARDAYYRLDDDETRKAESKDAHSNGLKGKIVYTSSGNGIVIDVNADGHYIVELHDSGETVPDDVKLTIEADEDHTNQPSEYIKSFVFGGLDGIVTCFAIVATAYGAGLSSRAVFLMGISNLIADGFAMGLGEYFSGKAEHEYALAERKREMWEFTNFPEGEQLEMVEIYRSKGFTHSDATSVIKTMARYPDFFVDHMMVEELGINPPSNDESPFKQGAIMFVAFCTFGVIPLISFAIALYFLESSHQAAFIVSTIATLATLFGLGAAKGAFIRQSKLMSGLMMVFNGAIAVGLGFGASLVLSTYFEDPVTGVTTAITNPQALVETAYKNFLQREFH